MCACVFSGVRSQLATGWPSVERSVCVSSAHTLWTATSPSRSTDQAVRNTHNLDTQTHANHTVYFRNCNFFCHLQEMKIELLRFQILELTWAYWPFSETSRFTFLVWDSVKTNYNTDSKPKWKIWNIRLIQFYHSNSWGDIEVCTAPVNQYIRLSVCGHESVESVDGVQGDLLPDLDQDGLLLGMDIINAFVTQDQSMFMTQVLLHIGTIYII